MGLPFAEGLRMLVDNQQRFTRAGLEVYLRVQNFTSQGDFQEMGVPNVNPATGGSGYTDILIDPPPQVIDVSMHNIGMSGGKLLLGARSFIISHSFVLTTREQNPSIPDDIAVWYNWDGKTPVVGIMYENRMHEIVFYTHKEVAGETVSWKLTCNRVDVAQDVGAQEPGYNPPLVPLSPSGGGGTPLPDQFGYNETPSGVIDGVNKTFMLLRAPNPPNSLDLFLNGLLQDQGVGGDYTLSANVITFMNAPPMGSTILASYNY